MSQLPLDLEQFLPAKSLPVLDFLNVKIPLTTSLPHPKLMRVKKFESNDEPTVFDASEIARLLLPPRDIISSLELAIAHGTIRSVQCPHVPTSGNKRYPISTVNYWRLLVCYHRAQDDWKRAVNNLLQRIKLEKNLQTAAILQDTYAVLTTLPWSGRLKGFELPIDIKNLASLLKNDWLFGELEMGMLEILKRNLSDDEKNKIFFEDVNFTDLLAVACSNVNEYRTEQGYKWIQGRGEALASGERQYLVSIVNQDEVHWVAIILDFTRQEILYADSLEHSMQDELKEAVEWWTYYHTGLEFTHRLLPITKQQDGFSCGVLAWDAIRVFFSRGNLNLMDAKNGCDERIRVFLQFVSDYKSKNGDMVSMVEHCHI